jgi:hypothetical protein
LDAEIETSGHVLNARTLLYRRCGFPLFNRRLDQPRLAARHTSAEGHRTERTTVWPIASQECTVPGAKIM